MDNSLTLSSFRTIANTFDTSVLSIFLAIWEECPHKTERKLMLALAQYLSEDKPSFKTNYDAMTTLMTAALAEIALTEDETFKYIKIYYDALDEYDKMLLISNSPSMILKLFPHGDTDFKTHPCYYFTNNKTQYYYYLTNRESGLLICQRIIKILTENVEIFKKLCEFALEHFPFIFKYFRYEDKSTGFIEALGSSIMKVNEDVYELYLKTVKIALDNNTDFEGKKKLHDLILTLDGIKRNKLYSLLFNYLSKEELLELEI